MVEVVAVVLAAAEEPVADAYAQGVGQFPLVSHAAEKPCAAVEERVGVVGGSPILLRGGGRSCFIPRRTLALVVAVFKVEEVF